MGVRAVVFDIGGVLEYTPKLGVYERWCGRLGLTDVEFGERTRAVWRGGDIGTLTLDEVHSGLAQALAIDPATVTELMEDMWVEYLGTPNTELISYARGLRPRYRTGILSNSFVGARERLGVAPHEAVFLDDVPECVEAARDFGMRAVLFEENTQAIAAIEELLRS